MKKIKARIERIGLNFKKELITIVIIALVGVILAITMGLIVKQYIYPIVIALLTIICEVVYISRYKQIEEKQRKDVQDEFIAVFSFFKIYIHNGYNVYKALIEVSNFVGPKLKDRFEKLIVEIDEDKSVEPYVKFAKTFDEITIEQMMISVYQMNEEGTNSPYFNQFELIFGSLSNELHKSELENKDRSLSYQSAAPLMGSALLVVLVTIGIVTVIGEMIGGL